MKTKTITYSKTIGVYPLREGGYRPLCGPHAIQRGLERIARTGVAAAIEPARCADCDAHVALKGDL